MARSVGEAIATGLESGIGLALRLDQNKRSIAADARAEERMKQVQEREAAAAGRQQTRDGLAALGAQKTALAGEVQAATDAGIELPPARQMAIAGATKEIDSQMNRAYADMGGADIDALTSKYDEAIAGMKAGKLDPSTLSGPEFGAVFTQATGFTPKAFMRGPGGEPSQIEQAAAAVQKGIEGGDQQSLLGGLNVLLKPNIDKIIGKPSAHGGTIVGAELASLHDDPKGSKDDPRVVPMLKIFVREDNATGPAMENGATGFYMAPVTEGRGTGGDAKVKSIRLNDGFEFLGNNLKLVEVLNSPEAAAKVQEAYATPGMTPEDWQGVRAQLGVRGKKLTPAQEAIEKERGLEAIRQPGRLEVERVKAEETRKTNADKPATGSAGKTQQDINAIKGLGLSPDAETAALSGLVAKVTTGTKAQGLSKGGAGGGKGGGSAGLSKEERADIKEESDALDKKEQRVIALAKLNEPKEPKELGPVSSQDPDAVAEHKTRVAKYQSDLRKHEQALKTALEKIGKEQDELTARRQNRADARAPAGPASKPAPGGKPVLKFDKDGNPVTN